MNIIPHSSQQTSRWSGGTTTQLMIYPAHAEYAKRDFIFRISTATVETETSAFTPLPGFTRILMILKGVLCIHHQGQYSKQLLPFETDQFNGGWQTSAEGIVTDFNIMFAQNRKASLVAHHLKAGCELTLFSTASFPFGYLVSGKAYLAESTTVSTSDFVILDPGETVVLRAETDCIWLTAEVFE